MEAHTPAFEEGEDIKPKPGDISVCAYCGNVFVFDENRNLRDATQEDMKRLSPEERAQVKTIQRVVSIRNQLQ